MKQLFFSHEHSHVSLKELTKLEQKLKEAIPPLSTLRLTRYTTDYASLFLPFDTAMHHTVAEVVTEKLLLRPSMMILIGIGGSNLGTVALEQLFKARQVPFLYCADSVDPQATQLLYDRAEQTLISGHTIMLVIVSKSGTTTETIANAELFTTLLARYIKKYRDYMVIISDEGSPLLQVAQREKISALPIATKVGGRFSIFSPVGLFPMGMLGIDTAALLKGAASVYPLLDTVDNPAARSAAILYASYQKEIVIHDSFFFIAQAEGIGRWYRQLLAESIGKMHNLAGKVVSVGITPTISLGSVDLHSMAQLYLGAPEHRITTFISVKKEHALAVPSKTMFDEILPFIRGKKFSTLMGAMLQGTKKAYAHKKLPYMSIEFPEISPYSIGQFMQLKMFEIIYLGALFQLNPFDQPEVELYKQETRKILAHD